MKKQIQNINTQGGRAGFTLIEVMLSVALTVILLFGVNFIFATSATAVSAGNAYSEFNRQERTAQTTLFNDIFSAVKDPPLFMFISRTRMQFLNAADAQNSTDVHQVPIDNKGNFATVNPVLYGSRSHRVDVLDFFARFLYQRRTSDDAYFSNHDFGDDEFIQIGHANMPANDLSTYYAPDDTSAPQTTPPSVTGAYASDWTLLRSVIMLKDPNNISTDIASSVVTAPANQYMLNEVYYPRYAVSPATVYAANLTPLSFGGIRDTSSVGTNLANSAPSFFGDSRYDLAGTTIEQFRTFCADAIVKQQFAVNSGALVAGSRYPLWCAPLMYSKPGSTIWDPAVPAVQSGSTPLPWAWTKVSGAGDAQRPVINRFNLNPTIQVPLSATAIAQISPYFIQHCSQFIVEYAGDYMTQNADGTLVSGQPDGTVDYYVDGNGAKHIRWYGLPRKTTLNPTSGIRGYNPGDANNAATSNQYQDVIPLSDCLSLINQNAAGTRSFASFEVDCNFPPAGDYTANGAFIPNDVSNNGNDSRYACAWFNTTPSMIRILMKVDDPNNAIQDGPWYEYVFQLK